MSGDNTAVQTDTSAAPADDAGTVLIDTSAAPADDAGTVLTDGAAPADAGTTDTNSDEGAAAAASADDTAGAEGSDTPPDTYADFTLPEGMALDEAAMIEANPLFKELGLSQEKAQKVIDLYAKQVQASSQKQVDDFNQLMSDWQTQSKTDKEFGGDKYDENVKIARSAVNKYGTPELKQLLEDHGVGNHPEVIRFMVRVGHTLKEDVPGSVGGANSKAADRVSILYPNDS